MGRISVGFHRLGLAIAVPLALAAAAPPLSQLYDPDGPPIPHPASRPTQRVLAAGEPWTSKEQEDPRLWPGTEVGKKAEVTFETDGRKLFVSTLDNVLLAKVMRDFTDEETRRGRLFDPKDMPVLVGNVKVEYMPESRMPSYTAVHLKRGFGWWSFGLSGLLLAAAALVYGTARTIAWIIEGFAGFPRERVPSV